MMKPQRSIPAHSSAGDIIFTVQPAADVSSEAAWTAIEALCFNHLSRQLVTMMKTDILNISALGVEMDTYGYNPEEPSITSTSQNETSAGSSTEYSPGNNSNTNTKRQSKKKSLKTAGPEGRS